MATTETYTVSTLNDIIAECEYFINYGDNNPCQTTLSDSELESVTNEALHHYESILSDIDDALEGVTYEEYDDEQDELDTRLHEITYLFHNLEFISTSGKRFYLI